MLRTLSYSVWRRPGVPAIALALLLCAAPAAAHNATGNASPGPQAEPGEPQRRDRYMGTGHEGIVIETDPETGDRIMQVTPPPEQEQDDAAPVIIIRPEIRPEVEVDR
jgi:hypothetical protein